jgi:hypothetical protein
VPDTPDAADVVAALQGAKIARLERLISRNSAASV